MAEHRCPTCGGPVDVADPKSTTQYVVSTADRELNMAVKVIEGLRTTIGELRDALTAVERERGELMADYLEASKRPAS